LLCMLGRSASRLSSCLAAGIGIFLWAIPLWAF
jgi:hypothetical protein